MKLNRTLILSLLAILTGTLALAGCGSGSDSIEVQEPWARATAPAQTTGAIYATIRGGDEDDRLVSASVPTDVAGVTEIHETVEQEDTAASGHDDGSDAHGDGHGEEMDHADHADHQNGDGSGHGNMTMRPVKDVPIGAGETVNLEPGGLHIMLMELKTPLKDGGTVPVTLSFKKAGEIKVDASIRTE